MVAGRRLASPAAWVAVLVVAVAFSRPAAAHSMGRIESELRGNERYAQLVDREAPGFALQDPDGHRVGLERLRGKAVVLNFLYARCREACPLHSALIAKVQALVSEVPGLAERVQFVTVATDTEDAAETAAAMREHGALHALDAANWVFVHGGPGRERAGIELAKAYGLEFVPTGDAEQMHGVVTHVIDPTGRLRARFHGLKFQPLNLVTYAAALAHGEHAQVEGAVEGAVSGRSDAWRRRIGLGVTLAVAAVLLYGAWLWSGRRRTESSDSPSAADDGDTRA